MSKGSAISTNTEFLVSDGTDVKFKLCGKGLHVAGVTYQFSVGWDSIHHYGSGEDPDYYIYHLYAEVRITTSRPITISGTAVGVYITYIISGDDIYSTYHNTTMNFNKTVSSSGYVNLGYGSDIGSNKSGTPSISATLTCNGLIAKCPLTSGNF